LTEVYISSITDEHTFDDLPLLTAASFRQQREATISLELDPSADVEQIKKSLAPRLPLVIGLSSFLVAGSGNMMSRFDVRLAFGLRAVTWRPGRAYGPDSQGRPMQGKTLVYYYSPIPFKQEWHVFDLDYLTMDGERLQNKDADLDSDHLPHFNNEGEKRFLGACEAVSVD
jgi:hypothetical protein